MSGGPEIALARAGAHAQADPLLTDLAVLGVQRPGADEHRAALAADTAHALHLVSGAAENGFLLSMADALCVAAADRIGLPVVAADLLTPNPAGARTPAADLR
ncbi:hypothetical protein ACFW1A_14355 [Kitasatospora sp. NPDC058965]|uniref:hypothetical protein n=1 Tax=Kitasatospora sp. NPDC058965 TaxID=3346682 RepID=UPI0036B9F800